LASEIETRTPLVQVINLDRRPDRRESVIQAFKHKGISVSFVKAIEGLGAIKNHVPGLMDSETGVWQSHILAMKNFLKSDSEFTLILEDDATPKKELTLALLKSHAAAAKANCIDILQIGYIEHLYRWHRPRGILDTLQIVKEGRRFKDNESGLSLVKCEFRAGAHAYLISRRGATVISELLEQPPLLAFDTFLEQLAKQGGRSSGLRIFRLNSSIVNQASRSSVKSKIDSDVAN